MITNNSAMKAARVALLLALAAAMLFAGCAKKPAADDDWSYIKGKGTLVIGYTDYAPMNYTENGEFVGFDTEFARAMCEKLGLTPEFVEIEWSNKETELSSKSIDCIWNGLTVTEERRANMDFTVSYLNNQQVIVVKSADSAKYASVESFAGLTVVAEAGSAGEDAITSALSSASYVAMSAQTDALLEVKAGTADAAVIDLTMAAAMTGEGTDYAELTILSGIALPGEEYAVGFRPGSTATAKANEVIAALQADGTMAALAGKYGLTELLVG